MEQLVWRARVGLITTSGQVVTEPRYYGVAPEGVSFHTSRMLNPGTGLEGLVEMERNAGRAIEELATADVDSIAYCCTVSGALRGLDADRAFCRETRGALGHPHHLDHARMHGGAPAPRRPAGGRDQPLP